MTDQPTVLLHWDASGGFHWGATPDVRVLCVDERVPDDRIYEATGGIDQQWIDRVLAGKDPIDAAQ